MGGQKPSRVNFVYGTLYSNLTSFVALAAVDEDKSDGKLWKLVSTEITSSKLWVGNSRWHFGIVAIILLTVEALPPIPNVKLNALVITPLDSCKFSNRAKEPLALSSK